MWLKGNLAPNPVIDQIQNYVLGGSSVGIIAPSVSFSMQLVLDHKIILVLTQVA